jgi:CheY-like chemotaxis protein
MQKQLRDSLLRSGQESITRFNSALKTLELNVKDTAACFEILRTAHNLAGNGGLAGLRDISRLATGIEALVNKIIDSPEHSTVSTSRTIKHAVAVLGQLFANPDVSLKFEDLPPRILVVDDQEIARRAANYSLESQGLNGICLADPETAFMVLKDNVFEALFLDINMPNLPGLQFRDKMRALPNHKTTPIVFYSTAVQLLTPEKLGDCDCIAKPFLSSEFALKALAHSSASRLRMAQ